jgi:hypothetical protein
VILRLPDLGSEGDNPEQEIVIAEPNPNRSANVGRRPNPDVRKRIFILQRNPDEKTYGSYFFSQGLLIVDGPTVTQSNGKRSKIGIGDANNPNNFIQQLTQVIAKDQKG